LISKLKGVITEKTDKTISITIFQAITFEFFVVSSNDFILEQEYVVYTEMIFSPEKGYTLYAFSDIIQKKYFLVLQDCHGVGARLALQILLHLSVDQIYNAIVNENKLIFEAVSGIGKKKAEMIILELKSKINNLTPISGVIGILPFYNDFTAALKALGYNQKEIGVMVQAVYKDDNVKNISLSQLIAKALVLKNNL
jgi:Holliday junction DNA helicase RuvA